MGLLQRIGLALITGYVWFYTGERVFWSLWRPGDTLIDPILTWLVYAFCAYVCLIGISYFKVRSVAALFLVAAIFGWLIEGLISLTLFGVEGLPFPITISWTALAWHAIFILFCWYWMRQSIALSTRRTLLGTLALGVMWGIWSLGWALETPPVITTPLFFLLHGLIFTALYILALHAYSWLGSLSFHATKIEIGFFALAMLAYYALITIPTSPILALTALPLLFALALYGLLKNKRVETRPDILSVFQAPLLWRRSSLLLLAPVIATMIYSTGIALPTNVVFLIVLTPLGAGFFVWSLISVFRAPKRLS